MAGESCRVNPRRTSSPRLLPQPDRPSPARYLGRLVTIIWSVLALVVLNACQQRPPGVDFIWINGAEPQSLDPAQITGQLDGRLASALFEGLVTRDSTGRLVPGIAERWEISPDGKTYTFHLRRATWSNGDPLTAYDFYHSWRRALHPKTASPYAEVFFAIQGAEDFHQGRIDDFSKVGIRVIHPYSLEVQLIHPTAYFLDLVAFVTYLPVHIPSLEQYGDQVWRPGRLVSNGAYILESWRINDRVRLLRNENYWRKETVAFRRVDALAVHQANTAFNLYSTGQADLILDRGLVPSHFAYKLIGRADCHVAPILATMFIRFNVTRAPFNQPEVRRALHLAIDKHRIVNRVTRMGEPVARHLTPPGFEGYQAPLGPEFDPFAARELLARAGFPGGRDFPRITYLFNDSELNKQIAEQLQAMWQENLGITVELQSMEWSRYLDALNRLDYDCARSSWIGDYPDPNTFLDCFVSGRGQNRTGWSHPEYDALLHQAAHTLDPQQRFDLLRRAEKILVVDEMPIAPLYFNLGVKFFDATRLGGMIPNLVDEYPIRTLYWRGGDAP